MKNILSICFIAFMLPLGVFAEEKAQPRFTEGDYYEVLPVEASASPLVTEFFSFFCGHCYKFEPLMNELKKSLNSGVSFEKSHVDFMPRGKPEIADLYSKALYTATILKVEDKVIPKIFESVHVTGESIDSPEKFKALFGKLGVPGEKFDAAFNGFMTGGSVGQMKAAQEKVKLTSVPTIVVNGKYKVVTSKIRSSDEYIALVNYLTTLK